MSLISDGLSVLFSPVSGLLADVSFGRQKFAALKELKNPDEFYKRIQDAIISTYCKGNNQRLLRRGLVKLIRLFGSCHKFPGAFAEMQCSEKYQEMLLDQLKSNPDPVNSYLILKLHTARYEDFTRIRFALERKRKSRILGSLALHLGQTSFVLSNLGVIFGLTSSSALAADNVFNGEFEFKHPSVSVNTQKQKYSLIYICGIDNQAPYFNEQLETLNHFLPEANIIGVWNKSKGKPLDLLEVASQRFIPNASSLRFMVKSTTNEVKDSLKNGKPVIILGHSGGAAVAKEIWKNLSLEEKTKVGLVLVASIVDVPDQSSPTQVVIYNVNQSVKDPMSSLPLAMESNTIGAQLEDTSKYSDISNYPGHLMRSYLKNDPDRTVQKEIRRFARTIINSNPDFQDFNK